MNMKSGTQQNAQNNQRKYTIRQAARGDPWGIISTISGNWEAGGGAKRWLFHGMEMHKGEKQSEWTRLVNNCANPDLSGWFLTGTETIRKRNGKSNPENLSQNDQVAAGKTEDKVRNV